jgi:hypothetical protein
VQPGDPSRPRKIRSPSYPFISLREAVDRARLFFEVNRRLSVQKEVAVRHWGYSPKSSGANQTLAALAAFALLEGDAVVRLTERAVHILQDPESSPNWDELIRQAALSPPIHSRLWERYGAELPPDTALASYLTEELGFNPKSVDGFLATYKETLDFAKLREPKEKPSAAASPSALLSPPDLTFHFPLLNDNWGELRVLRKIAPEEEEQVKRFFEYWLAKIVDRP